MQNDKSPHIMNASTNLVGFSFILLTSLKAFDFGQNAFVDEMVAISITGFMLSTLLSFMSMSTKNEARAHLYEIVADYIFFGSLLMLFFVCLLLVI
jgi:hypothetical protein